MFLGPLISLRGPTFNPPRHFLRDVFAQTVIVNDGPKSMILLRTRAIIVLTLLCFYANRLSDERCARKRNSTWVTRFKKPGEIILTHTTSSNNIMLTIQET